MGACKWLPLLPLACVLLMFASAALGEQRCLRTQGRHKPAPSKEGLYDCHHYNENSCCTHNTTRFFVNSSAWHVGPYFWRHCTKGVSPACEEFIKNEMCFYYCSPNTYPWAKKISDATENAEDDTGETYSKVPICAGYCDKFFDACKMQPMCVTNWYVDWHVVRNNVTGQNERHCKADSRCDTFGTRFANGRDLCNKIFGDSYVYTSGVDCLRMAFDNAMVNPNDAVAKRLYSGARPVTAAGAWQVTALGSVLCVFSMVQYVYSTPAL